jgi:hypothetical protein
MKKNATTANKAPLMPRAMRIDQRWAMKPARRLPSGMPPRKASMKIDMTRPRMESLEVSCTREL